MNYILINVVDTKSFGSLSAYDLKYADKLKEENLREINKLKDTAHKAGGANVEIKAEAGFRRITN
ncbi:hypothetical protein [Lysinibacillus telephonicus]|uniref:hypothetical protein n=1 Tax=Lysinibacillus telephonicus TaxID=1714840 RepID=UPI000F822AD6|nr:hypothetical protein [Lysinibacillus telephonicus]